MSLDEIKLDAKNYNPDHDIKTTGGMGGIEMAEAIYQRQHQRQKEEENQDLLEKATGQESTKDKLLKFQKIAFRDFPACEPYESASASEYKKRLSELRKAGYSMQPHSHLNKYQLIRRLEREQRNIQRLLSDAVF